MKYPRSIFAPGRQGQVMSADMMISPAKEAPPDVQAKMSPMNAFAPWSSLRLEFGNSGQNGQAKGGGSGSIEVAKLSDVMIRTRIAMEAIMEAETCKKSSSDTILDTKVMMLPKQMSDLKGSTAREICSKYSGKDIADAVALLENAAKNNPKFAQMNMKQANALKAGSLIKATESLKTTSGETLGELFASLDDQALINKGLELQKANDPVANQFISVYKMTEGQDRASLFGKAEAISDKEYVIYDMPFKTPNTSKLDAEGMTKAYSLKITANPSHLPYPFHVELDTMRGRPMPGESIGLQPGSIIDRKKFFMDLQTWEWLNISESADWKKKIIDLISFPEQYQKMKQQEAENRIQK